MSAADTFVPRSRAARGFDASPSRRADLGRPDSGRVAPRQRGLLYVGLTSAIALAVVGGASYFAWTIYAGGGAAAVGADESIPVIVAAIDAYKTAPENPGGIAAPGGEFAFYSELEGRRLEVRPGEERVLPPPENPIDELLPELFDRPVPVPMPADPGERQGEATPPAAVGTAAAAAGVTVPPALASPILALPAIDQGGITPEPVALPTGGGPTEGAAPVVTEAAAQPAAPPRSSSTVQLASMRSAEAADQEVLRLRRLLPDLLANREPVIRQSVSNGTTYFRVSFSANGPIDAAALCSEIKNRALDCIVHN